MPRSSDIRMLIIDDDPDKLASIEESVRTTSLLEASVRIHIDRAECFQQSTRRLDSSYYDVIILDLKIPILVGDEARVEHSRSLYNYIRKIAPFKPFYILGLTSADEAEVREIFTEKPDFTIERFSSGGEWIEKLSRQINFVVNAKAGLMNYLNNNYGLDVLIVTARKSNEYDPILSSIEWEGGFSAPHHGLKGMHNRFGSVRIGETFRKFGIICLDEMGFSHSAAVTVDLVNMFRPRFMAMLGMCCGLKKLPLPGDDRQRARVKLGDVIVASETCCWDEGKYEDGDPKLTKSAFFNNRAVNKYPDTEYWRFVERHIDENQATIESNIQEYYEGANLDVICESLKGGVVFSEKSVIHRRPIVSGACVIDSGKMIEEIEARFPRAFGLEMEAHAFYSAIGCCAGLKPRALVIKGVADFGDGTKTKSVQPLASTASYLTYKSVLSLDLWEF